MINNIISTEITNIVYYFVVEPAAKILCCIPYNLFQIAVCCCCEKKRRRRNVKIVPVPIKMQTPEEAALEEKNKKTVKLVRETVGRILSYKPLQDSNIVKAENPFGSFERDVDP